MGQQRTYRRGFPRGISQSYVPYQHTMTDHTKPEEVPDYCLPFKATQPSTRTFLSIQGTVRCPDGTYMRPCAHLGEYGTSIPKDRAEVLRLLLKPYSQVEEHTLLKAWVETTTVHTTHTAFEIPLNP